MAEKRSAAELIDALRNGTYDKPEDEERPLGVPADYFIKEPNSFGTPEKIRPAFMEGDDYKPARLSPEMIARIQRQLAGAGVLTSKFRIGVWDDPSRRAYRKVLVFANQNGINDDSAALERLAMAEEFDPTPAQGDEPPLPPNPLDLQAVARRAGTEHLGGPLTAEQSSQLQSGLSAQMMSDNAPGSAGQAEYVRQKTRSLDPVRFDARNAVKVANVISRMLGGDMPSEQQQLPSG